MSTPLTRNQVISAIAADTSQALNIYADITAPDRYSVGHDPDAWITVGAELDEEHGGDWMPVGTIGGLRILEDALSTED